MASILQYTGGLPILAADPEPASIEEQLKDAMARADITPPLQVFSDGKIHRFSTKDDSDGQSGWYVCFALGGAFGDWRLAVDRHTFRATDREMTFLERRQLDADMAKAKALYDAERAKLATSAAQLAMSFDTPASGDHPYLLEKGIKAHDALQDGSDLIVTVQTVQGIVGAQRIMPDGAKRFIRGTPVSGGYHILGDIDTEVCIAEGFATGASVNEATGKPVAIAFNAGNLKAVAQEMRRQYPLATIWIAADNDVSGTGQTKAKEAADAVGASIIMPPEVGMDANDWVQAGHDINALFPRKDSWLVNVMDFSAKPQPISWLVRDWVQGNALMMVHGPSGCGKTFVVLDWAMHIASYQDSWHGKTIHGGAVAYLAGEGHNGLRGRTALWLQEHQPDACELYISQSGTDLNTAEGLAKAAEAIRAMPVSPRLVVVDTLHRFLLGDENSAQDTKTMLDACAHLMGEFDCSVLLVHHTGVNPEAQNRARGSSAWKGALDIEVSIENKDGLLNIIQRKNKDSELAESLCVRLEKTAIDGWLDEDGQQVYSALVVETDETQSSDNIPAAYATLLAKAWTGETMQNKPFITMDMIKNALMNQGKSADAARKTSARVLAKFTNLGLAKSAIGGITIEESSLASMLYLSGQNRTCPDTWKKCPVAGLDKIRTDTDTPL